MRLLFKHTPHLLVLVAGLEGLLERFHSLEEIVDGLFEGLLSNASSAGNSKVVCVACAAPARPFIEKVCFVLWVFADLGTTLGTELETV